MYTPKLHILEDQWSPFLRAQVSLAECHAEVAVWTSAKTSKSEYPTLQEQDRVGPRIRLSGLSLWFHFKEEREIILPLFREIILPLFMLRLPWDVRRICVLEQFIWLFSPRNWLLEAKQQRPPTPSGLPASSPGEVGLASAPVEVSWVKF